MLVFLIPIFGKAQQADSTKVKAGKDVTRVNGRVTDATDGRPLPYINVSFEGSRYTIATDNDGLSAEVGASTITANNSTA